MRSSPGHRRYGVSGLRPMVSMAQTGEGQPAATVPIDVEPASYPYGLCLSLHGEELEKLGLSVDSCRLKDVIHIVGMARVTSISEGRLELQIETMSAENESEESEEAME